MDAWDGRLRDRQRYASPQTANFVGIVITRVAIGLTIILVLAFVGIVTSGPVLGNGQADWDARWSWLIDLFVTLAPLTAITAGVGMLVRMAAYRHGQQ